MSPKRNIRVAIANKYSLIRAGIKSIIDSLPGYKVVLETDSGKVLLNAVLNNEVDVAITDIHLQHIGGFEVVKKAWQAQAQPKILLLSEHVHPYTIGFMCKFEVSAILPISVDVKGIRQALNDVLKKGVHFNRLMTKEYVDSIRNYQVKIPVMKDKEVAFLKLLASDMTYKDIALKLGIPFRTAESTRERMFKKFDLGNRTELVLFALNTGLVSA